MGSWFPRNDRPMDRELYCASLLALLKPWSDLSDLKTDAVTFEQVFLSFIDGAPKAMLDIIENIQYYYECYDGAKRRRETEATGLETEREVEFEEEGCPEDLTSDSLVFPHEVVDITDEDIEGAYNSRGGMRERLHAEMSLNTALDCGIFSELRSPTAFLPTAERVPAEELGVYKAWEEQLKAICRREAEGGGSPHCFQV